MREPGHLLPISSRCRVRLWVQDPLGACVTYQLKKKKKKDKKEEEKEDLSFMCICIAFVVLDFLCIWTEIQRQNEQRCEQEIEEIRRGVRSGNITPNSSLTKISDEALDEQKHSIRIADEKVALAVQAYDLVCEISIFPCTFHCILLVLYFIFINQDWQWWLLCHSGNWFCQFCCCQIFCSCICDFSFLGIILLG